MFAIVQNSIILDNGLVDAVRYKGKKRSQDLKVYRVGRIRNFTGIRTASLVLVSKVLSRDSFQKRRDSKVSK